MAKQITLKYQGKDYVLEYNRRSIVRMEQEGFTISEKELMEHPLGSLYSLFRGAFYMHHPDISEDLIDEILGNINDMNGLVQELGTMYAEPYRSLLPDDTKSGNATWGVN